MVSPKRVAVLLGADSTKRHGIFLGFYMEKVIREIAINGEVAYVPLTRGYVSIIDADDAHLVGGFNWYSFVCKHTVYAVRKVYENGKQRAEYLHRAIIGNPIGLDIDHINGDGLNNRRANLRSVSNAVNAQNQRKPKSNNKNGFLGVSWHKQSGKWEAKIGTDGKRKYLGLFDDPSIAHEAYLTAKRNLHEGCTI